MDGDQRKKLIEQGRKAYLKHKSSTLIRTNSNNNSPVQQPQKPAPVLREFNQLSSNDSLQLKILETANKTLLEERSQFNIRLKDKEQVIQNLTQENKELKEKLQVESKGFREIRSENAILNANLSELQNQIELLKQQLNMERLKHNEDMSSLRGQLSENSSNLERQNQQLRHDIKTVTDGLEKTLTAKKAIEIDNQNLTEENAKLRSALEYSQNHPQPPKDEESHSQNQKPIIEEFHSENEKPTTSEEFHSQNQLSPRLHAIPEKEFHSQNDHVNEFQQRITDLHRDNLELAQRIVSQLHLIDRLMSHKNRLISQLSIEVQKNTQITWQNLKLEKSLNLQRGVLSDFGIKSRTRDPDGKPRGNSDSENSDAANDVIVLGDYNSGWVSSIPIVGRFWGSRKVFKRAYQVVL